MSDKYALRRSRLAHRDSFLLFDSTDQLLKWHDRWMNQFDGRIDVPRSSFFLPPDYHLLGTVGEVDPRVIEMLRL